ncbi:hypothetical protein [Escherichia coli]|uniref:hypothetical protein n=1 Tax=Escherichia coli TaxID=562 RepID=UPI0031B59712
MSGKLIYLEHDKKLKLRERDIYFDVDSVFENTELAVYSFSKIKNNCKYKIDKKIIDGTSRFVDKHDFDIAIINSQSCSPFATNIVWDLTHQLDVGKRIYLYEVGNPNTILENEYYNSAFKLIEEKDNYRVYEKVDNLLVERNQGLSSWTFGIPVGPDEPTFLNYCVERILSLNIDDVEIILCGMPHKDFKYFDRVKIVGRDIPAPPVHITRKKNEIARASSKDNLCILHDRVILPSNFVDSMKRFGDMFPLIGFQSIYFADSYNLIPRRYSDFGVLNSDLRHVDDLPNIDKEELPFRMDEVGCAYQHCQRTDFGLQYLTGSLYICKRELWLNYPQNEDYYWDEYEDIEFALRISSKGIPSMINPYSFTQSINSRTIIHQYGYVVARMVDGSTRRSRFFSEMVPFLPRKPLFRITERSARKRMVMFAHKYGSKPSTIHKINTIELSGGNRFRLIFELIMGATISSWRIDEFIKDYCSLLLNEEMHFLLKKRLLNSYDGAVSEYDKKMVFLNNPFILNQLSNSFLQRVYPREPVDVFVRKKLFHKVSALVVAFFLKYFSKVFYFKLSVREIFEVINDTTPFRGR